MLLVVVGLLPAAAFVPALSRQRAAGPPDIVLVLVDDLTEADWRSLPETTARLPAVFPNYVHTDPLCCPSRASILRGQYPHNHGTLNNTGPSGGWESFRDQEDQTIAVVLQQAGYHTGLIGKYLNEYTGDAPTPPGWNYWFAMVRPSYFDWSK